jgi:hypothetical protein
MLTIGWQQAQTGLSSLGKEGFKEAPRNRIKLVKINDTMVDA